MTSVALISFRLGGADGVSVVAASWRRALLAAGFEVTTIAGVGAADHLVPGLSFNSDLPPSADDLLDLLAGIDVVIAENILSIPLNLPVSRAIADALAGRPALLHHHDLPWQVGRPHVTELPADDPAWRHVVINRRSQRELRARGIEATVVYNGFDVDAPGGDRDATRSRLGVDADEPLLLHPVRAIPRKNIPGALALAEAVGGTYWLSGAPEDGYDDTLAGLLASTKARVIRDRVPASHAMADAYAACDAVLFPSLWEGFGNPPLEASLHRRPVVVGSYPIGMELASLGFRWLPDHDSGPLAAALADPALLTDDLEHNRRLVQRHFSLDAMGEQVVGLLDEMGVLT